VALGSSMCAAVGAGFFDDLQAAAVNMVHEVETLQPNTDRHEEYQFYLDEYCAAYPALREEIHKVVDHEAAKKQ